MDDDRLAPLVALGVMDPLDRPAPATVDSVVTWGKFGRNTERVTYREAARRDPGYLQWAAKTLGGERGRLCAEALALHLGVAE